MLYRCERFCPKPKLPYKFSESFNLVNWLVCSISLSLCDRVSVVAKYKLANTLDGFTKFSRYTVYNPQSRLAAAKIPLQRTYGWPSKPMHTALTHQDIFLIRPMEIHTVVLKLTYIVQ